MRSWSYALSTFLFVSGGVVGFAPANRVERILGLPMKNCEENSLEEYKIPVSDGDPRFPSMLVGFNQRFYANNCKAVYLPRTPRECAVALDDILKNYEDGVKIRSGGHCYENFVMNNSTKGIIDVGNLQDWGYDKEKGYYLSTGETNWSAFKKIFNKWGKVLPGGSCYSVGLGGHISGGGDGIMSRKHGTTVDWLSGIEIVVKDKPDSDAYVHYVGKDSVNESDKDLFWACKGAGNGNFGIITKYYFKELPNAPKGAIITNLAFKWGDQFNAVNLKKILDTYIDFASAEDNRDSSAKFQIMHEAAGESQMLIHTAYYDDETKVAAKKYHHSIEEMLNKLYCVSAPSVALAGHAGYWSRPAKTTCASGGSIEDAVAETFHDFPFYDATMTMNTSGPNQRGKYKSAYMKDKFPMKQVKEMIKHLKTVPSGLEKEDMKQSLLQIDCFGGRINDFTQEDSALGQRSYVVKLQFQTYWVEEKKDPLHLKWIRDFYHEGMYKDYGGIPDPRAEGGEMFEGCYSNYPDVDLNDYKPEYSLDKALYLYFLENYEENERNLVGVKRRWDPANIFNFAQSIPVKSADCD